MLVKAVGLKRKNLDRTCNLHLSGCGTSLSVNDVVTLVPSNIQYYKAKTRVDEIGVKIISEGTKCCVGLLAKENIESLIAIGESKGKVIEVCMDKFGYAMIEMI